MSFAHINPLTNAAVDQWDKHPQYAILAGLFILGSAFAVASWSLRLQGFLHKWKVLGCYGLYHAAIKGWDGVCSQAGLSSWALTQSTEPATGVMDFVRFFVKAFLDL